MTLGGALTPVEALGTATAAEAFGAHVVTVGPDAPRGWLRTWSCRIRRTRHKRVAHGLGSVRISHQEL